MDYWSRRTLPSTVPLSKISFTYEGRSFFLYTVLSHQTLSCLRGLQFLSKSLFWRKSKLPAGLWCPSFGPSQLFKFCCISLLLPVCQFSFISCSYSSAFLSNLLPPPPPLCLSASLCPLRDLHMILNPLKIFSDYLLFMIILYGI